MKHIIPLVTAGLLSLQLHAQTDTVYITPQGHFYYENFLPYSAYASFMNRNGDPYLYTACRELGIVTFDISDPDLPFPVDTIPTTMLNNLIPNNISQYGDHLYVALGGFNLIPQKAGMAILEITDPAHPVIADKWDSTAFDQGAAIVISDGAYAYLGAMDDGLVILDVSDKHDIKYVSSILPDPNYPEVPDIFSVPNARGLCLYGSDTLMVAYDAGGLRMIDISDRENPVEIGKYADPDIEAIAQSAYNNIAIKDHYAYIPVDMCGLIVIDIATSDMSTALWFNPWDCDTTTWFGSPGHSNEVRISEDGALLFISGGDSELLVFDISDPSNPIEKGSYGMPFDSVVAWGLDVRGDMISLALIDNSFVGYPYYSDVGGIQLLTYEAIPTVGIQDHNAMNISLYPNPANAYLNINGMKADQTCEVLDMQGRTCIAPMMDQSIDCSALAEGIYLLQISDAEHRIVGSEKFVIAR